MTVEPSPRSHRSAVQQALIAEYTAAYSQLKEEGASLDGLPDDPSRLCAEGQLEALRKILAEDVPSRLWVKRLSSEMVSAVPRGSMSFKEFCTEAGVDGIGRKGLSWQGAGMPTGPRMVYRDYRKGDCVLWRYAHGPDAAALVAEYRKVKLQIRRQESASEKTVPSFGHSGSVLYQTYSIDLLNIKRRLGHLPTAVVRASDYNHNKNAAISDCAAACIRQVLTSGSNVVGNGGTNQQGETQSVVSYEEPEIVDWIQASWGSTIHIVSHIHLGNAQVPGLPATPFCSHEPHVSTHEVECTSCLSPMVNAAFACPVCPGYRICGDCAAAKVHQHEDLVQEKVRVKYVLVGVRLNAVQAVASRAYVRYWDWVDVDMAKNSVAGENRIHQEGAWSGVKDMRMVASKFRGILDDANGISHEAREILMKLWREQGYTSMTVAHLAGGKSGALVLQCRAADKFGRPLLPCILKIDSADRLNPEILKHKEMLKCYGSNNLPRVKSVVGSDSGQLMCVMELAGSRWAIPELYPTVTLVLLRDVYESEQSILQMNTSEPSGEAGQTTSGTTFLRALHDIFGVLLRPDKPCVHVFSITESTRQRLCAPTPDSEQQDNANQPNGFDISTAIRRFVLGEVPAGKRGPTEYITGYMRDHIDGKHAKEKVADFLEWLSSDESIKFRKARPYKVALTHGDLHASNCLLDNQGGVWLIDFAFSEYTIVLRDIAKMESVIWLEYVSYSSLEETAAAVEILSHLARLPTVEWDTEEECPIPLDNTLKKHIANYPVLRQAWDSISVLRRYAAEYTSGGDQQSQQYNVCLLYYALRTLSYNIGERNQVMALLWCEILCRSLQGYVGAPASGRTYPPASEEEVLLAQEEAFAQYCRGIRSKYSWVADPITGEMVDIIEQCASVRVVGESLSTDVKGSEGMESDDLTHLISSEPEARISDAVMDILFGTRGNLNTIIVGPPGSGKTLTLHQIMVLSSMGRRVGEKWTESMVPLLVPAVDIVRIMEATATDRSVPLLERYLTQNFGSSTAQVRMLYGAQQRGRLMVLLDGLDEVHETNKESILNWISNNSAEDFSAGTGTVVISSRPAGWDILDKYTLPRQGPDGVHMPPSLPMSWAVILELTERMKVEISLSRLGHRFAGSFLHDIYKHQDYRELSSSPMLLSLLAYLYKSNGGRLPRNKTQLYKGSVAALMGRLRHIGQALSARSESGGNEIVLFLEALAFRCHCQNGHHGRRDIYVADGEAVDTGKYWKGVLKKISDGLVPLLPALEMDGPRVVRTRFLHLAFQEFLAARHIFRELCAVDATESLSPEDLKTAISSRLSKLFPKPGVLGDRWYKHMGEFLGGLMADSDEEAPAKSAGRIGAALVMAIQTWDDPKAIRTLASPALHEHSGRRLLEDYLMKDGTEKKKSLIVDGECKLKGVVEKPYTPKAGGTRQFGKLGGAIWLLRHALKENRTLTDVNLSKMVIGDEGAAALSLALKDGCSLTALDITDGGIGPQGATDLGDALRHNTTLRTLHIGQNPLCEDGVTALSDGILSQEGSEGLNVLTMWKVHASAGGGHALSKVLEKRPSVVKLKISSNGFGAAGVEALMMALSKNTTIKYIDVNNEYFSAKAASAAAEAIKANPVLEGLILNDCRMSESDIVNIAEATRANPRIKTLGARYEDVARKALGDDRFEDIFEIMQGRPPVSVGT